MPDQAKDVIERELEEIRTEMQLVVGQQGVLARRMEELRQMEAGLIRVLQRLSGQAPATGPVVRPWGKLSRREAIVRVLESSDRPLAPREIVERLKEEGRDGDARNPAGVYNMLTKLKATKVIDQPQAGVWWMAGRPVPKPHIDAVDEAVAGQMHLRSVKTPANDAGPSG